KPTGRGVLFRLLRLSLIESQSFFDFTPQKRLARGKPRVHEIYFESWLRDRATYKNNRQQDDAQPRVELYRQEMTKVCAPHFPSPTKIKGAQKYGWEVEMEIGLRDGNSDF